MITIYLFISSQTRLMNSIIQEHSYKILYINWYHFRGGTVRPRAVPYGQGKGTIWLSKVDCTGTEAELTDCKHEKWGEKGKCTHMDDVGIECTAKQTHGTYPVRMLPKRVCQRFQCQIPNHFLYLQHTNLQTLHPIGSISWKQNCH